jgi:hypothetical protein
MLPRLERVRVDARRRATDVDFLRQAVNTTAETIISRSRRRSATSLDNWEGAGGRIDPQCGRHKHDFYLVTMHDVAPARS